QAEDGIRDRNVTGVQTCALPIFSMQQVHVAQPYRSGNLLRRLDRAARGIHADKLRLRKLVGNWQQVAATGTAQLQNAGLIESRRSEERRVGKESRSGRARDD